MIFLSNFLYGTAEVGGSSGNGTVFAVNTDGTGFTNLHNFGSVSSDGSRPYAELVLSGNTLYGTTTYGGSSGRGTLFAVNVDGTGFANLHNFTGGGDGAGPFAGLTLSGNIVYGAARGGGSSGSGTVFALNKNGAGFTNFYSFNPSDGYTNVAGGPNGTLILWSNTLYGTTFAGGTSGSGTLFAVSTDGTGFRNLHNFSGASDGATPYAGLILSGNTLFGTASAGGSFGYGTVFAANTDGTGFRVLHHFGSIPSDGAAPKAGLILSGNALYGTASAGGSVGDGTAFVINTDGTGFTILYSFTGGSDGAYPYARLLLFGRALYGTTESSGFGNGIVFSLSLPPPQLTIVRSGLNVILTWPTNANGFTLQSTTNLVSSVAWTNVSPGPVVVEAQNTVTNPISGLQRFYRLSQ